MYVNIHFTMPLPRSINVDLKQNFSLRSTPFYIPCLLIFFFCIADGTDH